MSWCLVAGRERAVSSLNNSLNWRLEGHFELQGSLENQ